LFIELLFELLGCRAAIGIELKEDGYNMALTVLLIKYH
jgi:hypothetical protein